MQKSLKKFKKITSLIVCFIILVSCLFIATKPAFAGFNRGTVKRDSFNALKVVLDRPLKQPDGYIRKREIHRITPLNPQVNVYNKHEEKIGFAKKSIRRDGMDIYDTLGTKTGFYRKTLQTPQY